ncbi:MAG: class I SAM-dependent methyltransferase [Gemmataceae bacterium]
MTTATIELNRTDLLHVFRTRYGIDRQVGPKPQRRLDFGYFSPDLYYEATVEKLVTPGSRWLDVGGGRDVFPMNPQFSQTLANRTSDFVGVDPSANIHENPFVRERRQCLIEDYQTDKTFDVITMRMVAEHVTNPQAALAKIASLLAPNGKLVVYTINKWTPIAIAAMLIPFRLHHPIKKLVWKTEEQDTFPVSYQLNTRRALRHFTRQAGLTEMSFRYLDDCRTFFRFDQLHYTELRIWRFIHRMGLTYPENCLLGVYSKPETPSA